MKNQKINEKFYYITAVVLATIVIIASVIAFIISVSTNFRINSIQGVDKSFFNDFNSGGENIYKTAKINMLNIFLPFLNLKFGGGQILQILLTESLFFMMIYTGNADGFSPRYRFRYSWGLQRFFTTLPLLCLQFMVFLLPMIKTLFYYSAESQIYEYFGREMFNEELFKNQLEVVKLGLERVYFIILITNLVGITSLSVLTFITIYAWFKSKWKIKDIVRTEDERIFEVKRKARGNIRNESK
ncbi:hypothetical protein [Spiroplasma alleghenense]|uniref:Uncharacterized protein n=1 Tax=Spiroplasma alleghenense TaxID=216931 RepID=A0A345Z4Z1_9MOLU|nr:hypothetical protein [Spiroplasma alleghenense]AXK51670.1 hypothetical protein SALLE_v1c10000 [Spiroplasma alleghenense]